MSAKPSVSAAKARPDDLDRPFSVGITRRARRYAVRYRFLVEPEGKRFVARVVEFPEVVGVGASPEEALQQAVELGTTAVAVLMEARRKPPLPCAGC